MGNTQVNKKETKLSQELNLEAIDRKLGDIETTRGQLVGIVIDMMMEIRRLRAQLTGSAKPPVVKDSLTTAPAPADLGDNADWVEATALAFSRHKNINTTIRKAIEYGKRCAALSYTSSPSTGANEKGTP